MVLIHIFLANERFTATAHSAIITNIQLTFLSLLPEWDHLIELSLYQPISLLLIQPFTTREGLLYPCERTVHHHLQKPPHNIQLNQFTINHHIAMCVLYLLTVPPSTDSSVVVSNGHSAERAEECSNLNIEDVCQATLELSPFQKHLDQICWGKVDRNGGSSNVLHNKIYVTYWPLVLGYFYNR